MTIYPCRDCRFKNNCDIKDAKLKSVKGLGLTSIKFTCSKRKEDLKPGMVVKAALPAVCVGHSFSSEEGETPIIEPSVLTAVFMGWAGTKKARIGFIDTDQPVSENEGGHCTGGFLLTRNHVDVVRYVKVNPRYLTPTGEAVVVCRGCGKPKDAKWDGWSCSGYDEDSACIYPMEGEC